MVLLMPNDQAQEVSALLQTRLTEVKVQVVEVAMDLTGSVGAARAEAAKREARTAVTFMLTV